MRPQTTDPTLKHGQQVTPLDDLSRRFAEDGFAGPLSACSAAEMRRIRAHLEKTVFADGGGAEMRHLNCRMLYDLCSAPALLDALECLLGPNIVLWRSRLFIKEPSGAEIPWHNDGAYFKGRLAPLVNITAWIALDDVDRQNSCVRFIPGSHKNPVPHARPATRMDPAFRLEADRAIVDESAAVYMEMRAGCCVLFDESVLHSSTSNTSGRRRAGLSARFTIPSVQISDRPTLPLLLRGHDDHRLHEPAVPEFRC